MTTELLVSPTDLGTYLDLDGEINVARATLILRQAQDVCEDVRSPIPGSKLHILYAIAERAYDRGRNEGNSMAAAAAHGRPPVPRTGVYLLPEERADLLDEGDSTTGATTGTDAFTIRLHRGGAGRAFDAECSPPVFGYGACL